MSATAVYIIGNSGAVQNLTAGAVAWNKWKSIGTFRDIKGVATGSINAILAALTQIYDYIYCACESSVVAATGKLTMTQLGTLYTKLKVASQGTTLEDQTATIHTSTSIGVTGIGWTVDEFLGKWLYIYSGTGAGQLVKITSNDTDTLTVPTLDTTPDATSKFLVVDTDAGIYEGGNASGTKLAPCVMWDIVYPGIGYPQLLDWLSSDTYATLELTATGAGSSTNTLADTGAFAGLALAGATCYIKTATTGANQKLTIASHDDDELTLSEDWPIALTGTITYRVKFDPSTVNAREAMIAYLLTYMYNITDGAMGSKWNMVLDARQNLSTVNADFPTQETEWLYTEMLLKGETMVDYANKP